MSWDGDLRQQVLQAFRDAQRHPGELDTSDEPTAPATPVKLAAVRRERRIIRRAA